MGSRTLKNGVENNKKDLSAMPSYVPSVPTSTSSYLSLSALRVCNSKMGEGEFMGFYVHYKYRRGTSLGVNVLFRYQLVTCGKYVDQKVLIMRGLLEIAPERNCCIVRGCAKPTSRINLNEEGGGSLATPR
ncbi:hypothetical protein Golax_015526 [Gossypium laxum]|uniref:Uncharacterized protein n=1 Tax=Gossypium laxum TaxID=34288 RepID=A0A7J8ZZJ5_9ROSI|nr:hypothetical protein [Gossypium laxum]